MREYSASVLVVGGGPAGARAARALAASGVDALILERNPQPAPGLAKPCGGGIPSGAFSELGLPEEEIVLRSRGLRVFPPKSGPFEVPFKEGCIAMVDRTNFDRRLREEAVREGACMVAGAFISFREGAKGLVSEAEVDGRRVIIRSGYIIAADGVNSRVRAAAGMKPVESLFTLSGRLPRDEIPGASDLCEFHFSAHSQWGYSWVFPKKDHVSVGTGSWQARELKEKAFRFLSKRGLSGEKGISLRGYRVPLWKADASRLALGKVLFAGDAGGLVMPFTFEGIYYAIRSGELAADAIIKDRPQSYPKDWEKAFSVRFRLMKEIWSRYLKDDAATERLLKALRFRPVQERGIQLFLDKSNSKGSLIAFANVLGRHLLF